MTTNAADDRDKPSPDWTRPPEPAVHRAARKGDIDTLSRMIADGVDINERADLEHDNGPHLNGLTTLMVAARSIDGATVETLRCLVAYGADVHARSDGGNTAAWYAAGHGARWDFHDKAVTPDHVERLRYLLDLGLDPTECNFIGRSLLTEACAAGDPARVALLLERGASIDPNPMEDGHEDLLSDDDELHDRSDVPTGTGDSYQIPLFCASRSGSAECVQLILDAGADVNTRDETGGTALMIAGSADVVRVLLDAGADRDAIDTFGNDAFAAVLENSCSSGACGAHRFDVANCLVEAGINIEQDIRGESRLKSAAFGHHPDAVEFLLKIGAHADVRDEWGQTPLHAICWQGEYEDDDVNHACEQIIRTLVAAGIAVDTTSDAGATPMHEATSGDWGNHTAIRTLLELGAQPDLTDDEGSTPLMGAAYRGELACIELLLTAGADPSRTNNDGLSPVDIARGNCETWKDMVANGPDPDVTAILEETAASAASLAEQYGVDLEAMGDDNPALVYDQTKINAVALQQAEASLNALLRAATDGP
ncbi:MAG: ankyrin repeat domain-containing protein [Planctomycetota bacterium]